MKPFLDRIAAGEILIADGAMGTQLMAAGLAAGRCPEAFNLERPDVVEDISRRYREAGAEILTTNSFGGSPLSLARHGLDGETEAVNRAAAEAARCAAGGQAYVAGSIGPTGRLLLPYGDTEPAAVLESFRRQAEALAAAGVDLFMIETMTDLGEAMLAVKAAKEAAPALPVAASMTFDLTPRGCFTIMGADAPAAARGLAKAGADLVGSNCGNGSAGMLEVARALKAAAELPLLILANAGLPESRAGGTVYPESPETMAAAARTLASLGVSVIGGCCGTGPDHIRAIRDAVKPDGR